MSRSIDPSISAFVAGATGYTGHAIVLECRRRGLETIAHARPTSKRLGILRSTCEDVGAQLDTTAWELDALRERLVQLRPALLFAALGTTRSRNREEPGASYETVDFGLTMMLLEASRACDPAPRFVYLSAMGAGGAAIGSYMQARKRVERALASSGIPHTIVRPGLITGEDRPEDRRGERRAARLVDGLGSAARRIRLGRLHDRVRSFDGTTLASAMVAAALHPRSEHDVLDARRLRERVRVSESAP
jgi:nucleoside-diphosphate-sugar epimerase